VGCRRPGDTVRIGVCHTGIGVAPSQRRAIFQEFHRLEEGARVARGLGLGLSIVERLAKVLNHRVDVDSAIGRGSHFWIGAPLVATPAASLPPHHASRETGGFENMSVLCIDNEPAILEGMRTLLSGWGCSVITAPDLACALAALSSVPEPPRGVLIDYHLDDGDGISAIVALRERFGAELPAVLLTADRRPQAREAANAHGIPIMNKPIKPAALRALLTQWRVRQMAAAS
jgi:CheY-like chemotaxis protein